MGGALRHRRGRRGRLASRETVKTSGQQLPDGRLMASEQPWKSNEDAG